MYAAVKFLRDHNPTAAKLSELDLVKRIEASMMDCADDENYTSIGTMGYTVIKDDWGSELAEFRIVVDPGIHLPYEYITIDYSC